MVLTFKLVQDIQQLGSVIHAFRGHVRYPRPNVSTLPKLTIALEVVVGQASSKCSAGTLVLRSPDTTQELRRSAISVLLECEVVLTSDTSSLSLSFTHSTMLSTPITSGTCVQQSTLAHPASRIAFVTTRIVRVLPPTSSRPKITRGGLPTELLIKTFKDAEFRDTWHVDLLSCAQVCRAWACAMDILHARLPFSKDDRSSRVRKRLDVYVLANALREKPLLAHGFRHLSTDNLCTKSDTDEKPDTFDNDTDDDDVLLTRHRSTRSSKHPVRFTAVLIAILGTTKHLQHLHLAHLDPSHSDALFTALFDLGRLRTLSLGPVASNRSQSSPLSIGGQAQALGRPMRLLSVAQLARCMARWPHLTTLTIHHLVPGRMPAFWRFALRPPICALTQLVLVRACLSDRDLLYLFAPRGVALERVVLDQVDGISNAGLATFLRTIAPNLVALTVRDVALPPPTYRGALVLPTGLGTGTERALDSVVHGMPRLQELRIGGDVASEFMLGRRSRAFMAQQQQKQEEGNEGTRMPVVKLWAEDAPRLCGFVADAKWPGWSTPGKGPRR